METIFQILAVILIGIAAYCFWDGESDRTFAAVVLAVCFLFVALRIRIKKRMMTQIDETHAGAKTED